MANAEIHQVHQDSTLGSDRGPPLDWVRSCGRQPGMCCTYLSTLEYINFEYTHICSVISYTVRVLNFSRWLHLPNPEFIFGHQEEKKAKYACEMTACKIRHVEKPFFVADPLGIPLTRLRPRIQSPQYPGKTKSGSNYYHDILLSFRSSLIILRPKDFGELARRSSVEGSEVMDVLLIADFFVEVAVA